jgi:hypothetical protein
MLRIPTLPPGSVVNRWFFFKIGVRPRWAICSSVIAIMTMINCWVGTRDARAEDRGIASRC